jgi:hypothetical protein
LLTKEIKQLYPHLIIILGGANVEGDIGVQLLIRDNSKGRVYAGT